jgi:hypothetical protein
MHTLFFYLFNALYSFCSSRRFATNTGCKNIYAYILATTEKKMHTLIVPVCALVVSPLNILADKKIAEICNLFHCVAVDPSEQNQSDDGRTKASALQTNSAKRKRYDLLDITCYKKCTRPF